jgi:hypothetical protein
VGDAEVKEGHAAGALAWTTCRIPGRYGLDTAEVGDTTL